MVSPLQHTLLSCCARSLRSSSNASYTQDLGLLLQTTKARIARPSRSHGGIYKATIRSFASAQRPIARLDHAARLPIPYPSSVAKSLPSWPIGRAWAGLRRQSTSASPEIAWNASALPIKPSSSSSATEDKLPTLTSPAVSTHLFIIAGLVFSIVVVGGLTRLTESGLSITEWNLVTGTLPPLSQEAWQSEYAKYMVTPEGMLMNKDMTLEEFKRIYGWEWGHRFLGRIIGLAFLAPIPYFLIKRKASKKTAALLFGIATLIGGQGALGWYMVKSGITTEAIQARDGVPRVSQYRLAAHLGMAFLVYALSLRHALAVRRDWNLAKLGRSIAGVRGSVQDSMRLLNTREARRLRYMVNSLTGMVFLTAISGAFVAGLDAGLLYNTFPYMGDTLVPPISELYSHKYSRSPDQSDLFIRNSLENPTTVQLDHRVLAVSTFSAIVGLFLYARRPAMAAHVPAQALKWIKATLGMAVVQVSLGISTLVYLVPIELAAAHQAGSLVLLSLCIAAGASLRRPSTVAMQYMRRAGMVPNSAAKGTVRQMPKQSVVDQPMSSAQALQGKAIPAATV